MNYQLVVRRPAKADVRSAVRRYEVQRSGLGREFVAEVDAALGRVAENPLQYKVLHRETRRNRPPVSVRGLLSDRGEQHRRVLCEPLAPRYGVVESSRSVARANKRVEPTGSICVVNSERRWAGGSRARR